MKAWWARNWPWLVPFGFLVAYELYALATRIPGSGLYRPPTLSQLVWWAQDAFPPLVYIVTAVVIVLWVHFFIRKRKEAGMADLTFGQKIREEPIWTKFLAGSGLVGVVVALLKGFGVEVSSEVVSAVFVFIGALVTAWQRSSVTSTAKIERLEDKGALAPGAAAVIATPKA